MELAVRRWRTKHRIKMAVTGQNFTKWKGDDFTVVFTIEDAYDLTGYSAEWNLSVDTESAKLITKKSSLGHITFDNNKVVIAVASAETKESVVTIPAGIYYHELQLIDSQGKRTVAATGTLDLKSPSLKRP